MDKNTQIDFIESEIHDNDLLDTQMREHRYFIDIFDTISESVVTDEYYDKNQELFAVITDVLFDINERSGKIPPELARKVIEGVFSSIQKIGIR